MFSFLLLEDLFTNRYSFTDITLIQVVIMPMTYTVFSYNDVLTEK